jgi:hypothetical protein
MTSSTATTSHQNIATKTPNRHRYSEFSFLWVRSSSQQLLRFARHRSHPPYYSIEWLFCSLSRSHHPRYGSSTYHPPSFCRHRLGVSTTAGKPYYPQTRYWRFNRGSDAVPSSRRPLRMRRPSVIPLGSWPRRMPAELAAGYCGEATVEAFIKRVGSEYPQPRITEGRRRLWLRDDLDQAILPPNLQRVRDVAEDL